MRNGTNLASCLLLAASLTAPLFAQTTSSGAEAVFIEYVNALKTGDLQGAELCWLPDEIENSRRLNISYAGTVPKYDCASPVISNLEKIVSRHVDVSVIGVSDCADYSTLAVHLTSGSDTLETTYYAVEAEGSWMLISRLCALTRKWNQLETRYARVHFADSSLINRFALQALDEAIEKIARTLEISDARMQLLADRKIDYYICSKPDFELLTGHSAHGVCDLQSDAIIARHLPHTHELAHLLINLALEEIPLHTTPFIQEGFAVSMGGRWGKSPEVIMQLGYCLLSRKICNPEDLLTYDGFCTVIGLADNSYPAAGILVSLLIEQCGIDGFKQLYRDLSGSDETVRSFTVEQVKADLKARTGWSWEELLDKLDACAKQYESSGLYPNGNDFSSLPGFHLEAENLTISIRDTGATYRIKVRSDSGEPSGILLLADTSSYVSGSYRSWMFTEQLPGHEYNGEKYGLVFDVNEAGLYDYYLNLLSAKYITMFSPESSYWNPETKTISIVLQKSFLEKELAYYTLILTPKD